MTLEEIKNKFIVNKFNEQYLLYSLTEKGRMNHKYLCAINKKGNKFFVDGYEPTNIIDELEAQVANYVKLLPCNSENYDPRFAKGVFEEFSTYDYLKEIGFSNKGMGNGFKMIQDNIYNIDTNIILYIDGLDYSDNNDEIDIKIYTNKGFTRWISTKCKKEITEIKKAINSLLLPLLISINFINIEIIEKLTTEATEINECGMFGFDINKQKFDLKTKLQELINKL